MTEIVLAFALGSAFLVAVLAFLPAKQVGLRPVRVRSSNARRSNRR